METALRNCRFLSLVMVELVLTKIFMHVMILVRRMVFSCQLMMIHQLAENSQPSSLTVTLIHSILGTTKPVTVIGVSQRSEDFSSLVAFLLVTFSWLFRGFFVAFSWPSSV